MSVLSHRGDSNNVNIEKYTGPLTHSQPGLHTPNPARARGTNAPKIRRKGKPSNVKAKGHEGTEGGGW